MLFTDFLLFLIDKCSKVCYNVSRNGGIAQLVRAFGSHPRGRRFEPYCLHQEKSKSRDLLFSIQSKGLVWNHPQGVWNPSQSDGMASRVSVYFSFGLITYITP